MNLRMAVGTPSIESEARCRQLRSSGMPRFVVALLAEPRHAGFQELRPTRAMRVMATCAVFRNRRVLPQERTAAFRVALVAVLVDARFGQQFRVRAPMRIVAIRACDLAFPERHVRRALNFGAAQLMALKANLRPRLLHELMIAGQRLL